MKHSDYLGHAISTEARAVGHCWRGYYRVDEGMFQAVVRLSQSEEMAHIAAKVQGEQAINRIAGVRAIARQEVTPARARRRTPRPASGG